jgi:hypothetical protein
MFGLIKRLFGKRTVLLTYQRGNKGKLHIVKQGEKTALCGNSTSGINVFFEFSVPDMETNSSNYCSRCVNKYKELYNK